MQAFGKLIDIMSLSFLSKKMFPHIVLDYIKEEPLNRLPTHLAA